MEATSVDIVMFIIGLVIEGTSEDLWAKSIVV